MPFEQMGQALQQRKLEVEGEVSRTQAAKKIQAEVADKEISDLKIALADLENKESMLKLVKRFQPKEGQVVVGGGAPIIDRFTQEPGVPVAPDAEGLAMIDQLAGQGVA